eukprot:TRINITY_DN3074_c0_g1_i3.p2 TRINITY_DN3074_c0_g1~~TRINITY_DN3074_c0_g1_i3.p2  ORF type:complete len:126 (+),score=6.67 TRINITY_DN3074_c0_g1_i3:434-811(+)
MYSSYSSLNVRFGLSNNGRRKRAYNGRHIASESQMLCSLRHELVNGGKSRTFRNDAMSVTSSGGRSSKLGARLPGSRSWSWDLQSRRSRSSHRRSDSISRRSDSLNRRSDSCSRRSDSCSRCSDS